MGMVTLGGCPRCNGAIMATLNAEECGKCVNCGYTAYTPFVAKPLPVITEMDAPPQGGRYERAAIGNRRTKAAYKTWRDAEIRSQLRAGLDVPEIGAGFGLKPEAARAAVKIAIDGHPDLIARVKELGAHRRNAHLRRRQAARAARLEQVASLRAGGYSSAAIAHLTGVTRQTIERDMAALARRARAS